MHDISLFQKILNGQGRGIKRNIIIDPISARFFVKFILSAILAVGSSIFQKVCIVKVTGMKNMTREITPIVGLYPERILRPPIKSNTPAPKTASFGTGTPLDLAKPLNIFN